MGEPTEPQDATELELHPQCDPVTNVNPEAELEELVEEAPEASLRGLTDQQQQEAEAFALEFLRKVLRLRGVRVTRAQFLRAELHKRGIGPASIELAIRETPVAGGITPGMLDDIALASIRFETRKSSALSFASGVPGGFAMFATVPADITQFYVHAFRVMQKLAYLYGWQSLLEDAEDIDDETLGKLVLLLGVMMGVGAASGVVTNFAANVARPAVEKQIARVALTKTTWYGPMKQVLRIVGVKVTKQTFAKTVAKSVPLLGGAVSGGMTMLLLDRQSKRLMVHLREIPPPNVDAAEYLAAVRRVDEEGQGLTRSTGSAIGSAVSSAMDRFRGEDADGDNPSLSVRQAAKVAAASFRGGVSGAAGRLRGSDHASPVAPLEGTGLEVPETGEHSGRNLARLSSLSRRKKSAGDQEIDKRPADPSDVT